jgi:parvulin-like peptidyl-prolyl isomerase
MKKTNFNIKTFLSKVKAFFVRINPFKSKALAPVSSFIAKRKLLVGGTALVVAAFVGGYFLKGYFVAATVNGSPISRFAVIGELEKRGGPSILDNLINDKLIRQDAMKKNITVSKAEIDAAIATIETNLKSQSQDLNTALAAQGMTLKDLRDQITLQKLLEKLLADKITVTDDEITKYITDNKISIPAGSDEANTKSIIKQQIVQEKLGQEVQPLLDELKKAAKINIFVKY